MSKPKRLNKAVYEAELVRLQGELVKMQEWVRREGERVVTAGVFTLKSVLLKASFAEEEE